jgi:hypothetical protein
LALEKFVAYKTQYMKPENLKGSKGVWCIMVKNRIAGDDDASDKGTRAGDLSAMTQIKAWVKKEKCPYGGATQINLEVEGATLEEETDIRKLYDYLRTVVPSGKFGTEVGRYLRDVCQGVRVMITQPGETGQGKGSLVYVPESHTDHWKRYCDALAESGCAARVLHMNCVNDDDTAEAVCAAVESELEYELGKMEDVILNASVGKKGLEGRQSKLEELKSKLGAYASHLGSLADGMRKRIDTVDEQLDIAVNAASDADDAMDLFAGSQPANKVADVSGDLFS